MEVFTEVVGFGSDGDLATSGIIPLTAAEARDLQAEGILERLDGFAPGRRSLWLLEDPSEPQWKQGFRVLPYD